MLWVGVACSLVAAPAAGELVSVYTQQDNHQDDWTVEGIVHEIGCQQVFPYCQQIDCVGYEVTTLTACTEAPYDDPQTPNMLVEIKNLCPVTRCELYYVSDPETDLSNWDEWVDQAGGVTPQKAFKIDHLDINQPLVFESMNWDNCFEPGETWKFIIQDYTNTLGGPPHALDSIGVGSMSGGWPPSTGSIITPEPAGLVLMVLGGLALVRRRKG